MLAPTVAIVQLTVCVPSDARPLARLLGMQAETAEAVLLVSLAAIRDRVYLPRAVLDDLEADGFITWSRNSPRSLTWTCGLTSLGWRYLIGLERSAFIAALDRGPG